MVEFGFKIIITLKKKTIGPVLKTKKEENNLDSVQKKKSIRRRIPRFQKCKVVCRVECLNVSLLIPDAKD